MNSFATWLVGVASFGPMAEAKVARYLDSNSALRSIPSSDLHRLRAVYKGATPPAGQLEMLGVNE